MSQATSISVDRLAQLEAQGDLDLIDVRTPIEFRGVHAASARNVPLDALDPHAVINGRNGKAADPLYVICQSGNRSSQACQRFIDAGYDNVVNVDGGTAAWERAGLPVVRGQKSISIERQVRIVTSLLILLGATLALFVHPYFAGLSAIIAAGVLYSGITDSCAMGMFLAKMPWNQVEQTGDACCSR